MPADIMYLGLELTSSHLVILLIDQKGKIVEQLQRSHGSQGLEQDPQDWWRAVRTGIKETLRRNEIDAGQIRSIGITASSNAPILLDHEGKVLCPTYIGVGDKHDELQDGLTKTFGARNHQNIINQIPHPNSAAAKLVYLREHYPRAWHDASAMMLPSSFLRFRLSGKRSIDAGSASETQLFNTKTGAWSKMLLQRLNIPPAAVPSIGPGEQICGRVGEEAALESGLAIGTPVVQAGHRASCMSVVLNALEEDTAFIELNNYGNCYFPSDSFEKIEDDRLSCMCHGINGKWLYTASEVASTDGVHWLMDEITTSERQQAKRNKQNPLAKLSEVAAEIAPGSNGLVFVPPNNEGAGGFVGLNLDHKHGHMIRSVYESCALQIRQALDIFSKAHAAPKQFAITGEAADNTLWCQIISDAVNMPVKTLPIEYPAALGAALLAGLCIGNFKDLNAAARTVKMNGQSFKPRQSASKTYEQLSAHLSEVQDSLRAQAMSLKEAQS